MHLVAWDDSTAVAFDREPWTELTSLGFLADTYNVLIIGSGRVGKTFLANSSGHIAVRRNHAVHTERADKLSNGCVVRGWTAATKTRCANGTAQLHRVDC
ncbi:MULTISPECIES: ATP-binding protein [Nocardia]|nr:MULTISPECIES: ATP-binding protein [Nocardia]